MEPVFETRESLIKSLDSLLRESISRDSWGQIIEASQGYKMFVRFLSLNSLRCIFSFPAMNLSYTIACRLSRCISEAISYSGQFSYEEKVGL